MGADSGGMTVKTNFVMTVAGRLLAIITILIALRGPVLADEVSVPLRKKP